MFQFDIARRSFLGAGGLALSGSAVALLAGTVRKLGGTPVEAKAKYTFPVETLKTQNDVLRFAGSLEKGAVSAYLGAVPLFKSALRRKAAGRSAFRCSGR